MRKFALAFICLFQCHLGFALDPSSEGLFVRVIDVGNGHAAVIIFPDNSCVVYDAGHWKNGGRYAYDGLKNILEPGSRIDLLVLSHSDADHLAATPKILNNYKVTKVLRSGLERDSGTWKKVDRAIKESAANGETIDYNLQYKPFNLGEKLILGGATVTLIHGWHKPPWWYNLTGSEARNGGSIVIRVEYKGKSIIFTGDSVGRHSGDPNVDALIASEKRMVEFADQIKIDSDVLIAAHHGADNGTSTAFIDAVSPQYVIFPSGHEYGHPRNTTVQRLKAFGLTDSKLFRTDLGSNEATSGDDDGAKEWRYRNSTQGDGPGDDDVDVLITPQGKLFIDYKKTGE